MNSTARPLHRAAIAGGTVALALCISGCAARIDSARLAANGVTDLTTKAGTPVTLASSYQVTLLKDAKDMNCSASWEFLTVAPSVTTPPVPVRYTSSAGNTFGASIHEVVKWRKQTEVTVTSQVTCDGDQKATNSVHVLVNP